MSSADPTRLVQAFRILRGAWFNEKLFHKPHERQWESVEQESRRNADNYNLKKEYDQQTERIIAGDVRCDVYPLTPNDVTKHQKSRA